MLTPDLILFAAKSTLRLSRQIKKAFINNAKNQKLVLPLPKFPTIVDWRNARNYFEDAGKEFVDSNPRVADLLLKAQSNELTETEESEFSLLHQESRAVQLARNGDFENEGIIADEMEALVTIVQWERGKNPNPTALQRVAGTMVEIAVDYFVDHSEALNSDSKEHKALRSFLVSIDDAKFAESPIQELAPQLFISVIESINQVPELLINGEKGQDLIKGITERLSNDINEKIEVIRNSGGNLQKEENIKNWGLFVFRSTLESAGEIVLAEPNKYIGALDNNESALVTEIVGTLLNIVLEDVILVDSSEINIGGLFSKDTLNELLKTTLRTISEHPDLIDLNNNGIENILTQVLRDLSNIQDPISIQLFPEVGRIIIERTAGNLTSIWPDSSLNPANHLLIIATNEVLESLSKPVSGTWKPKLTRDQLLEVTDFVIDEVVKNPDWILVKANATHPLLRLAIDSVLCAMAEIPENRLSKNYIRQILKISISKVALRLELLDHIPGQPEESKTLITRVLEMILVLILDEAVDIKVKWAMAREEVLHMLISNVLDKLSKNSISLTNIEIIETELEKEIKKIIDGKPFSVEELLSNISLLQLN